MSQTAKSGSSLLPGRKHSVIFFVLMSLGLFALIQAGDLFHGAWAAPNVDIREGRVTGGEGRDLRHFVRSNPDNFLMMSGSDVEKAFDAPELSWAEFPGVVWQYRTEACVVDIYFAAMQEDVADAPVIHYEVRPRDSKVEEDADSNACLTALMRRRGGFFL